MPQITLDILYEDNHCIAVAKPTGVTSAHFQGQEQTLDRVASPHALWTTKGRAT